LNLLRIALGANKSAFGSTNEDGGVIPQPSADP
ncbi:unnamed protein product, partial [marine sediment metagenome]